MPPAGGGRGAEPEQDACAYRHARLTYAGWHRLSSRLGANLIARGLRRGDRLAILLPPRPEWGVAYLGAAAAGVITVGVNPRLGERLVVCRNPLLAEERSRKRQELLEATEGELAKIAKNRICPKTTGDASFDVVTTPTPARQRAYPVQVFAASSRAFDWKGSDGSPGTV